jgi:DNA-directed RNA polymerase specialized sigma24 family protein
LAARGRLDPRDEVQYEGEDGIMPAFQSDAPAPESNASNGELKGLLEEAILALPVTYPAVTVLRDVEEIARRKPLKFFHSPKQT